MIREAYMDEAGFTNVHRMVTGNVPEVDTIVIITAANPGGEPMYGINTREEREKSAAFNNRQMRKLYSILDGWKYGYSKIQGKYGYDEPSVVVGGMSKSEGRKLAEKFGQESFIFGFRREFAPGKQEMVYELSYTDGTPGPKRSILASNADIQNYKDFYSKVKGRKFQIPFFDDAFANKRLAVGQGKPEEMNPQAAEDKPSYRQMLSMKGKARKDFEDLDKKTYGKKPSAGFDTDYDN